MAITKTISLKEFSKQFKLDHKFLKENKKQVKDSVYSACLKSVPKLAEESPVDTGLYASAWQVEETKDEVLIGNTAPYADAVEYGMEPQDVPVQPLIEWAARQLQVPADDKQAISFGWAVKQTIKKYGLEPRYILTKGIDDIIYPNIKKELKQFLKNKK